MRLSRAGARAERAGRGPHGGLRTRILERTARALLLSLAAVTTTAAGADIVAGDYTIESQTVLPHLEEMRRISEHERTCIGTADVTRFFPVFRQPALTGCALHPDTSDAGTATYVLTCAGTNGASGNARLTIREDRVKGVLMAKMGGKNMTFSQHVEATRRGDCDPR